MIVSMPVYKAKFKRKFTTMAEPKRNTLEKINNSETLFLISRVLKRNDVPKLLLDAIDTARIDVHAKVAVMYKIYMRVALRDFAGDLFSVVFTKSRTCVFMSNSPMYGAGKMYIETYPPAGQALMIKLLKIVDKEKIMLDKGLKKYFIKMMKGKMTLEAVLGLIKMEKFGNADTQEAF